MNGRTPSSDTLRAPAPRSHRVGVRWAYWLAAAVLALLLYLFFLPLPDTRVILGPPAALGAVDG